MKKKRSKVEPTNKELALPHVGKRDQPIALPGLESLFDQIDRELEIAVEKESPENLFALAIQLNQVSQVAGIGLARLLWRMLEQWEALTGRDFPTEHAKKLDFEQIIYTRIGRAKDTLDRYLDVGDMYAKFQESIPVAMLKQIQERPISDQIAVAQNIKEHGALPRGAWREVAQAEDSAALRNALKEVRGKEVTGPDISFHVDGNGEFFAFVKRRRITLGFLRAGEDDLREPARQRAYERLKKRISLLED